MKILILESDMEYVQRLEYYLNLYAAEMQILGFDSLEKLQEYMEHEEFDVVLCGESVGLTEKKELAIPLGQIPFAWLSGKHELIDHEKTIYKYQSVPKIYEQLCDLYESVYQHTLIREQKGLSVHGDQAQEPKVITFFPIHGGAGSSVMAVSCAQSFSKEHKVLYLDLEQFCSESYFTSDNTKTFSDVIAEVRGKYTSESLQKTIDLAICHETDIHPENLSFIKGCKNAADIACLSGKTLGEILELLRSSKQYDYILCDASMVVGDLTTALIQKSDKLVFTMDASNLANQKLKKVQRYVQVEQRNASGEPAEQFLIYNKYYADADLSDYTKGMVVVGKFGRYRLKDNQQISRQTIVQNICRTPQLFEKLR
ncbi:AAA family ATPase [Ruminococcus sp.]|uniref:AAA family ATPase n=1 Tax=Ruminococcus sp. TaxID=41978 RepID=UPI0025DA2305|nr:AAA family ATPase [Ruminococcus sp.]